MNIQVRIVTWSQSSESVQTRYSEDLRKPGGDESHVVALRSELG
jgi:hypothetical protein